MNILVTVDSNYLNPLFVMLKSLFLNNQNEFFRIFLIHSSLNEHELMMLEEFISFYNQELVVIHMEEDAFKDAPVIFHYTKEMYYRLLAFKFLPKDLDRILYLDPDILVINKIRGLYEENISEYLYAASLHEKNQYIEINRIRLYPYKVKEYYNSGILLMNLKLQRQIIIEKAIYEFVEKYKKNLIYPDQDIINALYGNYIKNIDETLYNYHHRFYKYYKWKSKGKYDMNYVMDKTVIIHFCGMKKPWNNKYMGEFYSLYKHYEKLTKDTLTAFKK